MTDPRRRTNAEILQDTKDTEARLAKDVLSATLAKLRVENEELRAKVERARGADTRASAPDTARPEKLDLAELRAVNAVLRDRVRRDQATADEESARKPST